jgi:hypothetical protein
MGAALSYARRYALFTLVGIAGEDDLDAPDLGAYPESGSAIEPNGQPAPKDDVAIDRANGQRGRKRHPSPPKALLKPNQSAVVREQLIIELAAVVTADEAAAWAYRSLPAKNTLTSADAGIIEQAFRDKMQSVKRINNDKATSHPPADDQSGNSDASAGLNPSELDYIISSDAPNLAPQEDGQNVGAIMRPIRKRDKAHRHFVCSQPCLICGRRPSDAHHIRFGQPRALGRKVSDEFTVPLCRVHHRDLHRGSDEKKWWEAANIEPMEVAQKLWRETHNNAPRS